MSKRRILKNKDDNKILGIFKIWQEVDTSSYNDMYTEAIVIAENEEEARNTYPGGKEDEHLRYIDWVRPEHVKVEYIGIAKPGSNKRVLIPVEY